MMEMMRRQLNFNQPIDNLLLISELSQKAQSNPRLSIMSAAVVLIIVVVLVMTTDFIISLQ